MSDTRTTSVLDDARLTVRVLKDEKWRERAGWELPDAIRSRELAWVHLDARREIPKLALEELKQLLPVLEDLDPERAAPGGENPPERPPKAKAFEGFVFARAYRLARVPPGSVEGSGNVGPGDNGVHPIRQLSAQEVHLVVSPTFVITLAYQPLAWDVEAIELKPHEIQDGESGLELDPSRIAKEVVAFRKRSGRAEGSFGLDVAAVVLDSVVDSVFDALDGLRARADELEDEISQREWLVDRRRGVEDALDDHVLGLRRLVRQVRWAFMPSDEIEEFLSGPFLGFEREDAGIEFRFRDLSREADRALAAVRDVGDHIDHAADLMAGLRTDRLNKTMYVLTAVATVLLVPTLIAGIYGMNFRNMPELGWRFGYGETLLLMVVLGFGMWLGIRWFLERSLRRRPIVRQRKGGS